MQAASRLLCISRSGHRRSKIKGTIWIPDLAWSFELRTNQPAQGGLPCIRKVSLLAPQQDSRNGGAWSRHLCKKAICMQARINRIWRSLEARCPGMTASATRRRRWYPQKIIVLYNTVAVGRSARRLCVCNNGWPSAISPAILPPRFSAPSLPVKKHQIGVQV